MKPLSHVSPRLRYVVGGIVGALAATGLVMLGASLDLGDGKQVRLTGTESELVEETTTSTEPVADTSTSSTAPASVTERVIVIEKRVTDVEGRVDRIEATTTTTATTAPPGTCPEGASWVGTLQAGYCTPTWNVNSTTTTSSTTTTPAPPFEPPSTTTTITRPPR